MAPRTVYANLADGMQALSLWDQSLADMGNLGMIPCTASGANAVTLIPIASVFAPNIGNPPQQLQNFTFIAAATSTGSVTVNGLKLYKEDGATQAAANDLLSGVLYGIAFNSALNGAAGGYQISFPVTSILNPVISGATISGSTITTSTYNGNTWTSGTGTLTIAAGKTLTANNSLTLAGTDATTMTFPTTSATLARTDAANTFTGTQTIGALVATTINGLSVGAVSGAALNFANNKTLIVSNTLTLAGTDSTVMTFPTTSATLARTDAANTFTGIQTFSSQPILSTLTASSAVATDGSKGLVSVTNTGTGNNVLATSPAIATPTISGATITTSSLNGQTIAAGQYAGEPSTGSATAGNIGEYIVSNVAVGANVGLTNNTPANLTSISLTAGDWDVSANVFFNLAGTTQITNLVVSISQTSATLDGTTAGAESIFRIATNAPGGAVSLMCGPLRISLSGTTTIYCVCQSAFTTSTNAVYGQLRARRAR